MKKDFLSITDLKAKEIWQILLLAKKIKKEKQFNSLLENMSMVMIFEKPSLRTKLSFDIAMTQLGGHVIYFSPMEVGLGTRESVSDVAKVISSMTNLVITRISNHKTLKEFARSSKVPVINGLSDWEHPCQALADFLTIWETKGKLNGLTLAYLGDGENNVPHSLALGCALLGINFRCAAPKGFWMNKDIVKKATQIKTRTGVEIFETKDPKEAIKNADVVYTDTWISMGEETERKERLKIFRPYQVNQKQIILAKKDAIFMHAMPAYRGNEVTEVVIDGQKSVIFQQAENRLHAQKALLLHLLMDVSEIDTNLFL